jgi:hypothetical protein
MFLLLALLAREALPAETWPAAPLRDLRGASVISCSLFANCHSADDAGAVSGSPSSLHILATEFRGCTSRTSAGAVAISAHSVALRSVLIAKCRSRDGAHSAILRSTSDSSTVSANRTVVTQCTSELRSGMAQTLLLVKGIQFLSSLNVTFNIVNRAIGGLMVDQAAVHCTTLTAFANVSGMHLAFFGLVSDRFLIDHTVAIGTSAENGSLVRFVRLLPLLRNCTFASNMYSRLFQSNLPIKIEDCHFDSLITADCQVFVLKTGIPPMLPPWALVFKCPRPALLDLDESLIDSQGVDEIRFRVELEKKIHWIRRAPTNATLSFRRAALDPVKKMLLTRRRAFSNDDRIVPERGNGTGTRPIPPIFVAPLSPLPENLYDPAQEPAKFQAHLNGRGITESSGDDPAKLPRPVKRPRMRIVFDHDGSDEFAQPQNNNWLPRAVRPLMNRKFAEVPAEDD